VLDLFPRLKERLSHGGQQLSGGEQQMLSIGRALMTNPDCLILDEATEGLAPLIVHEIWNVIATIRATGIASVVVDRNYRAVLAHVDRWSCWKRAGRHVRARRRSGRRASRAGPLPRRLISDSAARQALVWLVRNARLVGQPTAKGDQGLTMARFASMLVRSHWQHGIFHSGRLTALHLECARLCNAIEVETAIPPHRDRSRLRERICA
jgi:energy-coupling factor transporter ATP-binding protein EcfA2